MARKVKSTWEMRKFASGELFDNLPELRFVGRCRNYFTRVAGMEPHHHQSALEITYIRRGSVHWWAGNDLHEVSGGQVYISRPQEVHGAVFDLLEPCQMYWMAIDLWPEGQRDGRNLLNLPPEEAARLVQALKNLPRVFTVPPEFEYSFKRLNELGAERRHQHTPLAARAATLDLLSQVIDYGARSSGPAISEEIAGVMREFERSYREPGRISDLAERLGWSLSTLNHRFRREVGIPPADYILRKRINEACRLLILGKASITAIAFELGFSSSQYFATAFKRIVGYTPRAFAAANSGIPAQKSDQISVNY